MKGSEWVKTLGEEFVVKKDPAKTIELRWERERKILEAILSGWMMPIEWAPITSEVGEHTVTIWVSKDVIRIGEPDDFVRISTTARTAQLIADCLGVKMITPKICDLIWLQADVRIEPQTNMYSVTHGTMLNTSTMVKHSKDVQAAIRGREGLVADIGKHWVIVNALDDHPGVAALYGWHTEFSRPDPDHPENGPYRAPCGGWMWQTVGMKHNSGAVGPDPGHFDYGMFERVAWREVEAGGERFPYDTAAGSPGLGGAFTYEKRMRCFRYPGVIHVEPEISVEGPQ